MIKTIYDINDLEGYLPSCFAVLDIETGKLLEGHIQKCNIETGEYWYYEQGSLELKRGKGKIGVFCVGMNYRKEKKFCDKANNTNGKQYCVFVTSVIANKNVGILRIFTDLGWGRCWNLLPGE